MEIKFVNGTRLINNMPSFRKDVYQFPFERQFDTAQQLIWMKAHWTDAFYWSAAYVFLIFVGKKFMANRKPFDLRMPLFVWNSLLAAFSILGAYRALPEFYYVMKNFGLHFSLCDSSVLTDNDNNAIGFWAYAFIASKVVELGDTAFIVLRKKPLIFLHPYHHVTVLCYSWLCFSLSYAPSRWYLTMNFTIHSAMYTYYALRAIGIRVPKLLAILITLSQIGQMFIGFFVTMYGYLHAGPNCPNVQASTAMIGLIIYGTYFGFFVKFFIDVYFGRGKSTKSIKKSELLDENANKIRTKKSD